MKKPLKIFLIILGITAAILTAVYFMFDKMTVDDPYLQQANILATHNKTDEAEKIYKELIAAPKTEEDLEADFHLGELYYNQSRSDSDPILKQAIHHYNKAIQNGYIEAMFPLANIYNYCTIDNNPPQKHAARTIYQNIIASPHATNTIKNRAHEKLVELNQELQISNTHKNKFTQASRAPQKAPQQPPPLIIRPLPTAPPRQVINIPPTRVRNDSQNVHDTGLQKTFLAGYDNLRKFNLFNKIKIPQREVDEHIKNYIKNNKTIAPATKNTALKALDHMKKTNSQITNLQGSTEMEVLTNVYNRIYAPDNEKNKEVLKEMLVKQLADSMPENHNNEETPVCAQGRVARVFSIFQAIDPQSDKLVLKPKWVLKEELANLASNTRDTYLKSLPKNRQDNYNNDGGANPEDQNDAIVITNTIKELIQKRASENYINSNILKHDELDKELKPLLENI